MRTVASNKQNTFKRSIPECALTLLGTLFAVLFTLGPGPREARGEPGDQCKDVLIHAVQDRSSNINTSSLSSAAFGAFCRKTGQKQRTDSGGNIDVGVPIEGVPVHLGAGMTDSSFKQTWNDFCGTTNAESRANSASIVAQTLGSDTIVSAWLQCMVPNQQQGLQGSLQTVENDEQFTIQLRWSPPFTTGTPKITGVTITNADCNLVAGTPPSIRTGASVPVGSGLAQVCRRQGLGAVAVVIQTDKGNFVKTLPRKSTPAAECGAEDPDCWKRKADEFAQQCPPEPTESPAACGQVEECRGRMRARLECLTTVQCLTNKAIAAQQLKSTRAICQKNDQSPDTCPQYQAAKTQSLSITCVRGDDGATVF